MLHPRCHCSEQGEEIRSQTIRQAGKVTETFPLMVSWYGEEPPEFMRPGTFPPALYAIARDTWFFASVLVRNPHDTRENLILKVFSMSTQDTAEYEDVFVRSRLPAILPEEPDATMHDLAKGSWDEI